MSTNTPKTIDTVEFGLMSPQDYREMSVTKIITADTYDDDGFPIDMGLMDPRLGVIDPGLQCKTCGKRSGQCEGHFGHIELAAPVVHPGFSKLIRRLLRGTCHECARLLLSPTQKEKYRDKLATAEALEEDLDKITKSAIREARKNNVCPYCDAEQKEVSHDKPTTYYEDGGKLMPSDIRDRFERIPDEDLEPLGINPERTRPEWMILTVLPVPPVTARPSITLDSGQRSEDDLTHKMVDIIRINQRFMENREAGSPQLIIEDLWELLQYHVTTFMDNEISGTPPAHHRSGRPLKTLSQRLKGKEGRFRGSLSGKRVNYSSRTVISPDPTLSVNEIGVPESIAEEMTQKVKVTRNNIDEIVEYVRRGPNEHPGANYVKRADGRRLKVKDLNSEELAERILEENDDGEPQGLGWTVERHLTEGDVVLFNRQPSLHRMSMMAHEVVVMPYKTFRLNTTVCPPYNADFDGDEMNMHVLQSEEALAEADVLMKVQEHILSPRFGGPIIGAIQDHISGTYLLTHDDNRFDEATVLDLLRQTSVNDLPEPAGEEDGEPYWTGDEVFSVLLPDGLDLTFESSAGDEVVINDGELAEGTIDEMAVGGFVGEIVETVAKVFDENRARRFIDDVAALAVRSIMHFGFSFGISDEDLPDEARDEIDVAIQEAEDEVENLIQTYERGELESLPGRTLEETVEMKIMQALGQARDEAGEIAEQYLDEDNPGVVMADSGARGSMLNLTQMTGCVGQQAVRGERINRGYENRTLSHFKPDDLSADARGFVRHSYKEGLGPKEFFFHAMGGREGLVDTAVRTSKSGYLQRRLINALQELEAQYDGTVRNAEDDIVQFEYGEDGVDPMKMPKDEDVDVDAVVDRVLDAEFDSETAKAEFAGDD
ncbi:DNA-directed RNA polymerase subunit A' [Haladaptatus sp. F3-133]|jgi:DNA-directed RNA polymerase subunit A'|uniref:DNA-directed RNA polymerase subunit Rpo1N n=1 Tax=Halorutilus salinus TaxID=2487751 RepID=A0A9Q4C343_9EURY|nr:DNA-directed RNA polymerase subunit A' [Halorutilus salinus]MCX2818084.1 DNA-directed RNA polymerase subunit A' [Halorutilus salinus]